MDTIHVVAGIRKWKLLTIFFKKEVDQERLSVGIKRKFNVDVNYM